MASFAKRLASTGNLALVKDISDMLLLRIELIDISCSVQCNERKSMIETSIKGDRILRIWKGIGNGISLLITVGILARLPQAFIAEIGINESNLIKIILNHCFLKMFTESRAWSNTFRIVQTCSALFKIV